MQRHAAFVPSLTGLGILSFPFPGTPVPGSRLLRPFGTESCELGSVRAGTAEISLNHL
jgi:hypothetical protein